MRHFAANMWRRQPNREVNAKLKQLYCAPSQREFDKIYAELNKMLNKKDKGVDGQTDREEEILSLSIR